MYILSDLNLRFLSDKSDFVCFRGKKIQKVTLIQKVALIQGQIWKEMRVHFSPHWIELN